MFKIKITLDTKTYGINILRIKVDTIKKITIMTINISYKIVYGMQYLILM